LALRAHLLWLVKRKYKNNNRSEKVIMFLNKNPPALIGRHKEAEPLPPLKVFLPVSATRGPRPRRPGWAT